MGPRGLYEAPAIEHEACPPTMGGESPRAIKYPAVIGLFLSPPLGGGLDLVTNRRGGRTGSLARGSRNYRKRSLREALIKFCLPHFKASTGRAGAVCDPL